ncbi:alpha/beta hydrolase [Baekduia soli]|uniref:Alpha/beta hydrolase n=1 Tax=Baekduia soli TaxID=496014 RepID=A0A5B8UBC5_9ACTN|nr:alpha/beta hydrolase [Baekduia soli]QEC50355.1 alpha/beta hydrolase [Baekduia soli]
MGGAPGLTRAADALRFGTEAARPRPAVVARAAREWLSTRDPRAWPAPPEGDGRPVLLVPGFLAGDASLRRLGAWLRTGGFRTYRSGIAANVDCMEPLLARLEIRAQDVVRRAGAPMVLVGQSRGGTLGRVLAARRPDLVQTLVTLGSPVGDQLAVAPRTRVAVTAVGTLGSLGLPGLFSHACMDGPCCAPSRAQLLEPFPGGVRYVAVVSPVDEVVRPEACLDPAADLVELHVSHVGMGVDATVWRALSARL